MRSRGWTAVSCRTCDKVHLLGDLSGRQRMNLVPWRKRSVKRSLKPWPCMRGLRRAESLERSEVVKEEQKPTWWRRPSVS